MSFFKIYLGEISKKLKHHKRNKNEQKYLLLDRLKPSNQI